MPLPLAAIGLGISAAGTVAGMLPKKRPNNRRAIAALRSAKPTGYLTDADHRAAQLTKGRLTEGAVATGRHASTEVSRRSRARGLAGSPSEERAQARVNQQTALASQHAGESGEELLYNTQRGRERFQQDSELAIFNAETGQAARDAARQDAQQGAFWNSLNEFMPTIMGALGGGGGLPNASLDYLAANPNQAYTPPAPRGFRPS